MANYFKGFDISSMQGYPINFNAVKNAGYDFCIFRNGIGNDGHDAYYSKYLTAAAAAGVYTACYNFIYPLPTDNVHANRDPIDQAKLHYSTSEGQPNFVDAEWPAPIDFAKWGVNATFINQWMLAYLQEYESLSGQQPIIYTYPDWAANVHFEPAFANYRLWIASYTTTPYIPKPWTDWAFWQNSSGPVKLPGTNIAVDTDFAKDLSLWTSSPVVVPPPVPVVNTLPPPPVPVTPPQPPPVVVLPPPPPPVPAPVPVVSNIFTIIWNFITNLFRNRNI